MSSTVGHWRARYTPGDWLVLAGPTSLVVLEPPPADASAFIDGLWEHVIDSASMPELATRLAAFKIDSMPSFAAFFWTDDGMRSLVRGSVTVTDSASGAVLATGEGIQIWSETGHAGVERIRLTLPGSPTADGPPVLSLPLVVGAVRVGGVELDASEQGRISSPQLLDLGSSAESVSTPIATPVEAPAAAPVSAPPAPVPPVANAPEAVEEPATTEADEPPADEPPADEAPAAEESGAEETDAEESGAEVPDSVRTEPEQPVGSWIDPFAFDDADANEAATEGDATELMEDPFADTRTEPEPIAPEPMASEPWHPEPVRSDPVESPHEGLFRSDPPPVEPGFPPGPGFPAPGPGFPPPAAFPPGVPVAPGPPGPSGPPAPLGQPTPPVPPPVGSRPPGLFDPPSRDQLDELENGDTQLMVPPPVPPDAGGPAFGSSPSDPRGSVSGDSMIMAVVCQFGHHSPQNAAQCRICGSPIAPQASRLVPRPVLAVLRASDGTTVGVDRAVLIGRAPAGNRSTARAPRLMTVPSPGHDISRTHAEVSCEGWQVVVTDLDSTNGTILVGPDGQRTQLTPGQPEPVQLRSVIELGDGVSVLIDFPQ